MFTSSLRPPTLKDGEENGGFSVGGFFEDIWNQGKDLLVQKGTQAAEKQVDKWFGTGQDSTQVQAPSPPTQVTPPRVQMPVSPTVQAPATGQTVEAESIISKVKPYSPALLAGIGGALTKFLSKSWLAAGLVAGGTYFLTDKMQKKADEEKNAQ